MRNLLIFDLDGVLVDACEWHKIAFSRAVKSILNITVTDEEHYSKLNGMPTKEKLKVLGIVDVAIVKQISDLKQKITIELINLESVINKDLVDKLKILYELDKYILACYTNSIRTTAQLMISKAGLSPYIDCLLTNQEVTFPKPNPEGYNKIRNLFNIEALSTYIFEDSEKGLAAARESGCVVIRVKNSTDLCTKLYDYIT